MRPLLCNSHTRCIKDADIRDRYYVITILIVVKMADADIRDRYYVITIFIVVKMQILETVIM